MEVKKAIEEIYRKTFLFYLDALAKARIENGIDEARRRLARADQDYATVTEFKTSLEKEIATYRRYLEGINITITYLFYFIIMYSL
jgi:hypothetical protein